MTYNFTLYNQTGSYWYHAHIDLLRASIHGALIIYPQKGFLPPYPLPTGEFRVLLTDWYHR